MSEAQKQLIERAGWACVRSLERAADCDRRGWLVEAAGHYEAAELSSRLAFHVAQVAQA